MKVIGTVLCTVTVMNGESVKLVNLTGIGLSVLLAFGCNFWGCQPIRALPYAQFIVIFSSVLCTLITYHSSSKKLWAKGSRSIGGLIVVDRIWLIFRVKIFSYPMFLLWDLVVVFTQICKFLTNITILSYFNPPLPKPSSARMFRKIPTDTRRCAESGQCECSQISTCGSDPANQSTAICPPYSAASPQCVGIYHWL